MRWPAARAAALRRCAICLLLCSPAIGSRIGMGVATLPSAAAACCCTGMQRRLVHVAHRACTCAPRCSALLCGALLQWRLSPDFTIGSTPIGDIVSQFESGGSHENTRERGWCGLRCGRGAASCHGHGVGERCLQVRWRGMAHRRGMAPEQPATGTACAPVRRVHVCLKPPSPPAVLLPVLAVRVQPGVRPEQQQEEPVPPTLPPAAGFVIVVQTLVRPCLIGLHRAAWSFGIGLSLTFHCHAALQTCTQKRALAHQTPSTRLRSADTHAAPRAGPPAVAGGASEVW